MLQHPRPRRVLHWRFPLVYGMRLQVLMRALPGWAELEADAVVFLSVAEERLLLALEPPAATPAQPLTAAMLQARPPRNTEELGISISAKKRPWY